MAVSINRDNWRTYAQTKVDPERWTMVIPAAGRGSRLGFDKAKILYPVAGRPILEWLLKLALPLCAEVVLVLSPEGRGAVEPELARLAPGRYRIAIQAEPAGMGDAVECGVREVRTAQTAVLWGDQAGLRPATVEALMRVHDGPLVPGMTVPTVWRAAPYIHFERDGSGRIVGLRQAREGDAMPETGESDTGFFCFQTALLQTLLTGLRTAPEARGAGTAEFNLLPIVPYAAGRGVEVLTPQLMSMEETVGINTAADARQVEAHLESLYA